MSELAILPIFAISGLHVIAVKVCGDGRSPRGNFGSRPLKDGCQQNVSKFGYALILMLCLGACIALLISSPAGGGICLSLSLTLALLSILGLNDVER